MSSSADWSRINTLLDAALDLPPGERAAFLDDACAGDDALRTEVEALLDAEAEAPDFLEDDAAALATPLLGDAASDAPSAAGHRLGPYRLVEEIGRGGMSVVYLAERADGQFEQQVALKLLPRYFETEDRIARFRAERQILASLEHPNIARLLDGGVAENGRPYLVMEHVEGQPITDYCAARDLSVGARLELLQAVCRAVQHAHRRLVVHRDLKPSNILVTETVEGPRVKLLDFGIAKLLDEEATPVTMPVTRTGEHWMTPEYAAPEQLKGEAVTTATDVYQLGVLAYELLTGRRPFPVEGRSLSEIERAVLETTPTKPSTAATRAASSDETSPTRLPDRPDVWRRRLRGDLDTIVMKALRKEPERRYASAEALAEDLHCHLDGRPVEARPATWRYRVQKFVRRNRATAVTGAAFVLLLIGYAVTVTVQARRIAAERDRAQQETAKAEQVTDFLVDLFEVADPNRAAPPSERTLPVRDILERGTKRVRDELRDQPAVLARMLNVLGRVQDNLGDYPEAESLLTAAVRVARRAHDGPHRDVASALGDLAHLYFIQGKLEEAEPLVREELDLLLTLYGERDLRSAEAMTNLGVIFNERGEYDNAEDLYRRALDIRRALIDGPDPLLANSLHNLATLLHDRRRLDEAEPLYREALAMLKDTVGRTHPYVAYTLMSLSRLERDRDNDSLAVQYAREAVDIRRETLGPEHPLVAKDMNHLARSLIGTGALDEAERWAENALAIHEATLEPTALEIGEDRTTLGMIARARGRLDRAAQQFRETLQFYRQHAADHREVIATLAHTLGTTHLEADRPEPAEQALRAALEIRRALWADTTEAVVEVQVDLGRSLLQQGRYVAADSVLQDAYAVLQRPSIGSPEQVADARRVLATLYEAWDKPARAVKYRSSIEGGE